MYDYSQTTINPIALIFTIIMCILILSLKRGYIIIPLILVACFITTMQRVVIFSVSFTMLRIIIMVGLIRIAVRHERLSMTFNTIDKILIAWTVIRVITYTILWSSTSAFIFIMGQSFDILGAYFFVRLMINDFDEYDTIIKCLIIVSIFIAGFMLYEQFSGGKNLFAIFGGVPEKVEIRGGKLRAQGAFGHSIMAGTFGATLMPLSWGLWHRNKKFLSALGVLLSLIITITSSSSGPVITFAVGIFGICFWLFNKYTKIVKNLFFLMIISLHLLMKGPVWHLIARIDIVGGSTGYHRFRLMDAAFENFTDWFVLGIKSTAVWGHGLQDITSQYILEGVRGGIVPLILFIIVIIKCFQTIGSSRIKLAHQIDLQKYIWALGVSLFAHITAFISVSYFEQMVFFYYLLVAMISSLNNLPTITKPNQV